MYLLHFRQLSDINTDLDSRVSILRKRSSQEETTASGPLSSSSPVESDDNSQQQQPLLSPVEGCVIAQELEAAGAAWNEFREVLHEVDVAVR